MLSGCAVCQNAVSPSQASLDLAKATVFRHLGDGADKSRSYYHKCYLDVPKKEYHAIEQRLKKETLLFGFDHVSKSKRTAGEVVDRNDGKRGVVLGVRMESIDEKHCTVLGEYVGGGRFRYILEKESGSWRIVRVEPELLF